MAMTEMNYGESGGGTFTIPQIDTTNVLDTNPSRYPASGVATDNCFLQTYGEGFYRTSQLAIYIKDADGNVVQNFICHNNYNAAQWIGHASQTEQAQIFIPKGYALEFSAAVTTDSNNGFKIYGCL